MLTYVTNTLSEDAQEEADILKSIGLAASVGRPRETDAYCVERLEDMGISGIYIEVADNETRSGPEIVDAAWETDSQKANG